MNEDGLDAPSPADDPHWPRASTWLAEGSTSIGEDSGPCDLGIIGVPAHRTSLSPTRADTTPAAIRAALARYSTYSATHDVDLASFTVRDFGDIPDPDGPDGEERVRTAVASAMASTSLLIAVGGDNSITHPVMTGIAGDGLAAAGLITLDAHHDLRDGISNGSPVRRLIEAGLPGDRIVQIGIADFANSAEYARRAHEFGITVITRDALRHRSPDAVMAEALDIAGSGGGSVHVDLDVDVCDRSIAPGCPASVPGGVSAGKLRHFAFVAGRSPRVRSIDITEIDAMADAPDQRTVRLGALLILEAAAGFACR